MGGYCWPVYELGAGLRYRARCWEEPVAFQSQPNVTIYYVAIHFILDSARTKNGELCED